MTSRLSRQRAPAGSRRLVLLLEEHESIWSPEAKAEVLAAVAAACEGLEEAGYTVVRVPVRSPRALRCALKPFDPLECVIFNWYEGIEHAAHDGIQIAALLDELGYTYTGADAGALLLAQDKTYTDRVLQERGIPTPAWHSVGKEDLIDWKRYPAIVKVANEHGSECLTEDSVVYDQPSLYRRVQELRADNRKLMVSEYVGGREFSVGLWGNGRIEALPVVEIDFSAFPPEWPRVRTSEAKWDTNSELYKRIRTVCPPRLPRALRASIEHVARAAYCACGLRDYGRIDIRLREDEPQVIDVNANPDIMGDGSFVLAAERAGYNYSAMLAQIVRLAIERGGA